MRRHTQRASRSDGMLAMKEKKIETHKTFLLQPQTTTMSTLVRFLNEHLQPKIYSRQGWKIFSSHHNKRWSTEREKHTHQSCAEEIMEMLQHISHNIHISHLREISSRWSGSMVTETKATRGLNLKVQSHTSFKLLFSREREKIYHCLMSDVYTHTCWGSFDFLHGREGTRKGKLKDLITAEMAAKEG